MSLLPQIASHSFCPLNEHRDAAVPRFKTIRNTQDKIKTFKIGNFKKYTVGQALSFDIYIDGVVLLEQFLYMIRNLVPAAILDQF